MKEVLIVVIPVILMLLLGKFCKVIGILSQDGSTGIKGVLTQLILPVAIFHGLATGTYSLNTLIMLIAMFGIIGITFIAGFLFRPLVKGPYQKYLPFITAVYEGGMIGYPLYCNLCGADKLSNIAMLDMAGCIFCFSIYLGFLQMTENGKCPSVGNLIKNAFTNPVFDCALLGIFFGATGLMKMLLNSPVGDIYVSCQTLVTASLTSMILLVVGSDMEFTKELIPPCLKAIGIRLVIQLILMVPAYFLMGILFPGNELMKLAVLVYFIAPPSFAMPSYVKDSKGAAYVSTTNSLYCIVTVVCYVAIAVVVR